MLLWASLLILAPISGQFDLDHVARTSVLHLPKTKKGTGTNFQEIATVPKSVISLHPPWTPVFQGETVNLTCNGFYFCASEKTKWYFGYYGKKLLRETSGNILEVHEAGMYRCQAENSSLSGPVFLTFATGPLILQSPYSVFEGDTLVLRCQRTGREKLTAVTYSWNGKICHTLNESFDLFIPRASSNNSGIYQCFGYDNKNGVVKSNTKVIKIQELFPHPKLKVSATKPIEGTSVNMSCETYLPAERSDTPLHFIFFRDNMLILSDWNESSELQIPAIWKENSGWYWCGVKTVTHNIHRHSLPLKIRVQRIPVSEVSIETHPPGGQAIEGKMLILFCSVAKGTGDITFSWHIGDTKESLGWKTQRSQRAELEIPVIWESHAGAYYCMADNSYGPIQSEAMNITVRGNKKGLIAAGATGGLLSILLLAVPLLFYYWRQKKSGHSIREGEIRSFPTPGPGASCHSISPAQEELKFLYANVHPNEGDLAYAEIQITQLGEGEASTSRTSLEEKCASIVYSEVKTQLPDNSTGNVSPKDEDIIE
ncbi:Fc receptor-like protein 4 isoform X2 [Heterocephalus glaber]|uniref:Fc receptor-like protein 4 n=1 Tax=Heterocephalus glaber TaxID=10181 RepID=A0A0P6J875_HETGA|nr:Fc receptor-like protein 4 isoform X2 [Heterocephalus glaber]